jgi:hypothetical protein
VGRPPEPEEELAGELGDLGIGDGTPRHFVIFAAFVRVVNNL